MKPDYMQKSFDDKLKSILENSEIAPPVNVWANIQSTPNIPKGILKKFLYKSSSIKLASVGAIGAAITTMVTVVVLNTNSEKKIEQNKISQTTEIINQQKPESIENITNKIQSTPVEAKEPEVLQISNLTKNNIPTEPTFTNKKENTPQIINENIYTKETNSIKKNDIVLNNKSPQLIDINTNINTPITLEEEEDVLTQNALAEEIVQIDSSKIANLNDSLCNEDYNIIKSENEFHIGAIYSKSSVWIFNQNTYGRFGKYEPAYKLDFGYSYGIMAGYDINKKIGFATGIILKSMQGQKYEDVFWGNKKVYREINLEYTHIPLILKIIQPQNKNFGFNYLLGVQYGKLNIAKEVVNYETMDAKDKFRKQEISGIIGVESIIYLNDMFYLLLGLRGSVGNDINAKGWDLENGYKRSHNIVLGANVSLNYYFNPKKKERIIR